MNTTNGGWWLTWRKQHDKLTQMFAIIKTGGKQYIVKPGDKVKVEKLDAPQSEEVVFDDVLLLAPNKPEESVIGGQLVKDYIVKGKVLKQGKGEKVIVYKYKPKKRYDKKQGHRQFYTEVEIIEIGKKISPAAKEAAPTKVSTVT